MTDHGLLHSSSKGVDANCELVVVGKNEDGEEQLALVTMRDIKEGKLYMDP